MAGALALGSLGLPGLPLGTLPRARHVLLLAPHPDDESIGCGGTVARWTAARTRVSFLLVSDGEASIGPVLPTRTIATRRRREAGIAAARLGLPAPIALGLPDGHLADHVPDIARAIRRIATEDRPDLVLTPWALERHADHRAVTRAVAAALPDHEHVWGYEAHTPIPQPSHVIDVTATLAAKHAALRAHVTAAQAFDLQAAIDLARWRSLATRGGTGAAEAFLVLPARDLDALLTVGDRMWDPASADRPSGDHTHPDDVPGDRAPGRDAPGRGLPRRRHGRSTVRGPQRPIDRTTPIDPTTQGESPA
ncbi:MAG: PIG-L family deacetylase [Nitriliruptoraceae bacterium]|nr:PIG-L family deacetylase [Nitriliruptoraceae bacterium]